MVKKKAKPYIIEVLLIVFFLVISIGGYLIVQSFRTKESPNHLYVSYEILSDNAYPVINEQEPVTNKKFVKPFNEEGITIKTKFYNYKQEKNDDSIYEYEDTFIPSTGIDYVRDTVFNVLVVKGGTVISVKSDELMGETITVDHKDGFISTYQSLANVVVTEGESVSQGQIVATSGNNKISQEMGNHLHFELYKDDQAVDPETYLKESGE